MLKRRDFPPLDALDGGAMSVAGCASTSARAWVPGHALELAFTASGPGKLHLLSNDFCGEGRESVDGRFELIKA